MREQDAKSLLTICAALEELHHESLDALAESIREIVSDGEAWAANAKCSGEWPCEAGTHLASLEAQIIRAINAVFDTPKDTMP